MFKVEHFNNLEKKDKSELILEREISEKQLIEIIDFEKKQKRPIQQTPEDYFMRYLNTKKIETRLKFIQFLLKQIKKREKVLEKKIGDRN